MSDMTTSIVVCMAIQVAIIAIVFVFRGERTVETYVADVPIHRWYVIALTSSATVVGGGMFIAVSQIGFEAGVYGILLGLIYLLGFWFFSSYAWQIVDKMKAGKHNSLNELIATSYSKRVAVIFSIVNALVFLALLAAQFLALNTVRMYLVANGLSQWMSYLPALLIAISLMLYPVIGGLRRDIVSDVVQWFAIAFGMVVVTTLLFTKGQIGNWTTTLPVTHWTGFGYGVTLTIFTIIFLIPTFFVRTDLWQRANTAKSEHDAKVGFFLAGLISAISYAIFTSVGMAAKSVGVLDGKFAFLEFLKFSISNGWVLGVVFGAFLGAVLSTADTYVNNFAVHFCRTFWPTKNFTLSGLITASFICVVAATIIAYLFADIVNVFVASFAVLIIFLIPIVGLWNARWHSEPAAFWSMTVGITVLAASLFIIGPKMAFIPAVVVSLAINVGFRLQKKAS
jgi:Na+/proline symporter